MLNTERSSSESLEMVPQLPPPAPGPACTRCGRAIPVHLDGMMCLTCQLVVTPPLELSASALNVKHRVWPWVLAVAVAFGGLTVAVLMYKRDQRRAELEAEYPVAASPSDRLVLSREVKAWDKGSKKLVASLRSFEPALVRVAANAAVCPIGQNVVSASEIDDRNHDQSISADSFSDLIADARAPDRDSGARLIYEPGFADAAKSKLDALLSSAHRARFRTQPSRLRVVDAIAQDSLVVVDVTTETWPVLSRDGVTLGFQGGFRSGYAYAFDRETGELRCAAQFEASSSPSVNVLTAMVGIGNESEALARDFEAQTDRAIAKALRVVAKPGEPNAFAVGVDNGKALTAEKVAELDTQCATDPYACTDLGFAIRRGEAPGDPAARISYLKRGCDGGDSSGCRLLGNALFDGDGIARDVDGGLQALKKGCDNTETPDLNACQTLGFFYSNGWRVEVDGAAARTFYDKACRLGRDEACGDLGVLYRDGVGTEADVEHALSLFNLACEGNVINACVNAAALLAKDDERRDEAQPYLKRACELGDQSTCERLKHGANSR